MAQPRRVSAWLLLGGLACLFVLSMASPQLWDHAVRSPAKPDLIGGQRLPTCPVMRQEPPAVSSEPSPVYAAPCPPPPALLAAVAANPVRDNDGAESPTP